MKAVKTKIWIVCIVGISTILLMIQNLNAYPPLPETEPGWEYLNNYSGSLTKHISLVLIAVFLEGMLLRFGRSRLYFGLLFLIYSVNLIWAFSNTIHNGGIAVLYSLWSVFIWVYLILIYIRVKPK